MTKVETKIREFRASRMCRHMSVCEFSEFKPVDSGDHYIVVIGRATIPLSGRWLDRKTQDPSDGSLVMVANAGNRTYQVHVRPEKNNEITLVIPK